MASRGRDALALEDLEQMAAVGCQSLACTQHGEHALVLGSHCHSRAGLTVIYRQGSGLLEISCRTCRRMVSEVRVASRSSLESAS